MVDVLRPSSEAELKSVVERLVAGRTPVEVRGAGSKRSVGRPAAQSTVLETAGLDGITLYEPSELVMSARAGTPLARIEGTLAERNQMLAFEPVDIAPAAGGPAGVQTIGAVFATGYSGARRISAGAARDHLLGVRAVNGRGELFKSGGRVLKNVTGYDVARALAGSWGTLAVLSEVTFKVLPRPESTATLVFTGLADEIATELMCTALGTPFEVSGTAHLTAGLTTRLELASLAREADTLTAIRIENFASSVAYRTGRLAEALKMFGTPVELGQESSVAFWSELRRLSVLSPAQGDASTQLWRISTAPRLAARVIDGVRRQMKAEALYDASGGVVWLEIAAAADAGAADIRRVLATFGGHATLIRAEPEVRATVEVFHPMPRPVEQLTTAVKQAFDPAGILNPGRMYATI